ncbi:MAG: oxidoreductase [Alphaproteobacteria bacterium]|nr:oxidoreductase [Alphaproteobacteria bacterium]
MGGARFRAIMVSKVETGQEAKLTDLSTDDLMDGDVVVGVSHSTVNYKDGLALTGKAPVVRRWPMIPGIDFAGVVEASADTRWQPGDRVLLNGYGLGETHFGGYAQKARVKGEWLVPIPSNLGAAEAMAIGTAGYTAMLAVLALEAHAVLPVSGPVLVTGAAGGVGSVAIALLSRLGYRVIAATGRRNEEAYLKELGAAEIIDRAELSGDVRPLAKERWSGAIDSVGSRTLANVLAGTAYGGTVAACGLAQGLDLPGSVAPFILRGVTLAGIDSVMAPMPRRLKAWERLATDLDLGKLAAMTRTIPLAGVLDAAPEILAGQVRGRLVVDVTA